MNQQADLVVQMLDAYKVAAFAKDIEAFVTLYDRAGERKAAINFVFKCCYALCKVPRCGHDTPTWA